MSIFRVSGERPALAVAPEAGIAPSAVPERPVEGAFAHAMRNLGREIDVGEARVASASRLHHYDTGALIALQAGIYRYSEAVDLASKIVDRASNAVRTVLQGGSH